MESGGRGGRRIRGRRGCMLMPGNQKMKKQVQKQVDKLSKMAKMW